ELKALEPNEALFRLAGESGVVLLPAEGFGTTHQSFRVSLANLTEVDYDKIGKAIFNLGKQYFQEFTEKKKKGAK
ncbi:MAG: bifunctional aspartate transaminase/aspartate 4-decarboxylase, partial [Planctomycetes bacterium]|nr:bifunctional aspartate transaminase/aspartate 4-decarboxylase [Planctomycetota bacterium]